MGKTQSSTAPKPSPERITSTKSKPFLVAGIDFGTTYSGIAYSFVSDFKSDPTKVTAKVWKGQAASLKAPTCILIEEDGETARAFGYNAETEYASDPDKDHLYLFKRFKMLLNVERGLNKEVTLTDVDGKKTLPAIKVFSLAIQCLKKELDKMLRDHLGDLKIQPSEIIWVLTVPAIWNDSAKQFMRDAAIKAGIIDDQLMIALEPEAASVYCRHLPHTKFIGKHYVVMSSFKRGTQYMVLDAGGGTVDVTIHEVANQFGVKEIAKASGGPWGGVTVDQAYFDFLENVFGQGILAALREESYENEIDLVQAFELCKRTVSPDQIKPVRLWLPMMGLDKVTHRLYGESIAERIKKSEYGDKISINGEKMVIDAEVFKTFYKPAVDEIITHVQTLMKKPKVVNCKHILMVGGFSESPMLQEAVKETFLTCNIIIPEEAGLSVLKGAVMFGHNPAVISERICRYTYGTKVLVPFEQSHPTSKLVHFGNSFYCHDVFAPVVQVGDCLKLGQPSKPLGLEPVFDSATEMHVRLFASKGKTPRYVTDDGCDQVGKIVVPMPNTGTSKTTEVCLILGGTEMQVECKYMNTGEVTRGFIRFLG